MFAVLLSLLMNCRPKCRFIECHSVECCGAPFSLVPFSIGASKTKWFTGHFIKFKIVPGSIFTKILKKFLRSIFVSACLITSVNSFYSLAFLVMMPVLQKNDLKIAVRSFVNISPNFFKNAEFELLFGFSAFFSKLILFPLFMIFKRAFTIKLFTQIVYFLRNEMII